jgi:hypothetical protein
MNFRTIINQTYNEWCARPTDINEHLPVLKRYADECNHVTEMGVRRGASSRAFLMADVTLRSYDIYEEQSVTELFNQAQLDGKDVQYIIQDVLQVKIEPTDMLFIDTWHSQRQLRQELAMHGNVPSKYLAFHDTHTYGTVDESMEWASNPNRKAIKGQGLLPAIIEFIMENPHWKFKEHRTNNNGLTVLERT